MADSTRFDVVLGALSHVYRRRLLVELCATEGITLAEDRGLIANGGVDPEVVHQQLFHVHLPKLAESGYIEWDRTNDVVRAGDRFGEIAPLLDLIDDHADELPEGWL